MSKQLLCGFLFFVLLTSHSSCILFRKGNLKINSADSTIVVAPVVDSIKSDTATVNPATIEKLKLIAALTPVWKWESNFSTFHGKAKMQYEGKGQRHEFTTIFRVKKNEIIWASVTALGGIVQVARVFITPDSFKLINYLEKEVIIMPLSAASKVLPAPADFTTLQNLVLGQVLSTSGEATDALDLGNIISLEVADENLVQQINYNKTDTTINTLQMRLTFAGGSSGVIRLSDYQMITGRKFPMNRNINVVNSGEQHTLEMNFNKADFDQPVDFPFSIPKSYKRK
ncbi:MAG TPA: DUF4292 domain-containing protein [Flavipsychrobacter sp.]|nr:DUF4292 domain-containing protein [Flavipsychrobacter sp.]